MILTAHILTGAAILSKTQNPILGFLFAFLSHYLLDFLPHQEYPVKNIFKRNWKEAKFDFLKVSLDIFFGFLLILIILFLRTGGWEGGLWQLVLEKWQIFLGGFFGILADGLTFLNIVFPRIKILNNIYNFHQKIHIFKGLKTLPNFSARRKIWEGWKIFTQILIGLLAILLLLK